MDSGQLEASRQARKNKYMVNALQIYSIYVLLMFVYDAFFLFEYRKPLFASNAIILFVVVIWLLIDQLKWQDFLIGCFLLYAILYFRLVSYAGRSSFWNNMPYLLIGFSLGLMLRYLKLSRILFYLYALLAITPFLYTFFVKGYEPTSGLFLSMNRNIISRLLIFVVSLQILVESAYKPRYITMLPSLLTVIVSYHSESRTGLLVSALLLLIVLIENAKYFIQHLREGLVPQRKKIVIFLGMVALGLVVVFFIWNLLISSRFGKEGLSTSGRTKIYLDFIALLTPERLLNGFRPDWEFVNLHNTYLTLLSYYGIGAVVFYFLIGGTFLQLARKSFIQAGLVAVFCIYSMSESVAPFSVGAFSMIPLSMVAYPPKRLDKLMFPFFRKEAHEPRAE